MAVVRSSNTVVVCLSEPLMGRTSSAALRLEKFVSRPCSTILSQFHFSVGGFMMYCRSELNKSVLSGSLCLILRFEVEGFAFDVGVYGCSLSVVDFASCVKCLLEVDGGDPKRLVPLGGLLSKMLECVQVICPGATWPKSGLVN